MNSTLSLGLLCIGLWLVATYLLWRQFKHGSPPTTLYKILWLVAVILTCVALLSKWQTIGGIPTHFFAWISLIGATMAVLHFIVCLRHEMSKLGLLIFPIAAMSVAFIFTIPTTTSTLELSEELSWHVVSSLLGYCLFAIATLQAAFLALVHQQLRSGRPSTWIQQLHSIQAIEAWLFHLITAGLIMLTIGIATGAIFLDNFFIKQVAHKTVFSILAWGVFVVLWLGHYIWGWRGMKAVKLTLSGALLLMIGFLGTHFVREFIFVS